MAGRYYIRTGRDNKMYTLWGESKEFDWAGNVYYKEFYIKTLGHNKVEALGKARASISSRAYLIDQSREVDDIADPRSIDHSIVKYGRYRGHSIYEMADGYLLWMLQENEGKSEYKLQIPLIEQELEERGVVYLKRGWQVWTFKKIAYRIANCIKREQQEANMRHVGLVSEKLTDVRVKVVAESCGEGAYGPWYFTLFEILDGPWKGQVVTYIGSVNYGFKEAVIDFKVKEHGEYNGKPSTKIYYIKIKHTYHEQDSI